MYKVKRVLESSCGTGRHSIVMAQSFLNPEGGVLVSTDFSGEMVRRLNERYSSPNCEYSMLKDRNKFLINTETNYCEYNEGSGLKHKCDIEDIISKQGDFKKFVYGC